MGTADLVIEAGLSIYDISAPACVIEAAGGVVTTGTENHQKRWQYYCRLKRKYTRIRAIKNCFNPLYQIKFGMNVPLNSSFLTNGFCYNDTRFEKKNS